MYVHVVRTYHIRVFYLASAYWSNVYGSNYGKDIILLELPCSSETGDLILRPLLIVQFVLIVRLGDFQNWDQDSRIRDQDQA